MFVYLVYIYSAGKSTVMLRQDDSYHVYNTCIRTCKWERSGILLFIIVEKQLLKIDRWGICDL